MACRMSRINLIQIPMGAEVRKIKGKNTIVKVPSPFDFIATKFEMGSVFFDAKTRNGDRIARSEFLTKKSTKRQLDTLRSLGEFGERTGFVVWFRASDQISFFSADMVERMKPRTSFCPGDGIELGTIENMRLDRLWSEYDESFEPT